MIGIPDLDACQGHPQISFVAVSEWKEDLVIPRKRDLPVKTLQRKAGMAPENETRAGVIKSLTQRVATRPPPVPEKTNHIPDPDREPNQDSTTGDPALPRDRTGKLPTPENASPPITKRAKRREKRGVIEPAIPDPLKTNRYWAQEKPD